MIVGWALVLIGTGGCGGAPPPAGSESVPGSSPPPASARPPATAPANDDRPAVVFLGTSLTAGYGLPDRRFAYPQLLQQRIDSAGIGYRVVNAGVSGETSAGARRRIEWVLQQGPVAVLVIETGANDGLRGQTPDSVKANIQAIVDQAASQDPPPAIVIAGMEAMPNLGARYTRRFRAIFGELARENGAALVPFLLDGVAGVDSLNQSDGIHPTAVGQQRLADNVWKVLLPVLETAARAGVLDP